MTFWFSRGFIRQIHKHHHSGLCMYNVHSPLMCIIFSMRSLFVLCVPSTIYRIQKACFQAKRFILFYFFSYFHFHRIAEIKKHTVKIANICNERMKRDNRLMIFDIVWTLLIYRRNAVFSELPNAQTFLSAFSWSFFFFIDWPFVFILRWFVDYYFKNTIGPSSPFALFELLGHSVYSLFAMWCKSLGRTIQRFWLFKECMPCIWS